MTFQIETLLGPFELCHCSRCRKVSGSAFMAAIGASTAGYRMLTGQDQIRQFRLPVVEQPPGYGTTFCGTCGSPVPPPDPPGDRFEVPAGALDGDPGFVPDKHIYVDHQATWYTIADGLPQMTKADIRRLRGSTSRERP